MDELNQNEIEKITERSLSNQTSQVNDFIRDLKTAGANPGTTMTILSRKLGIDLLHSKQLVFASPSWKHLGSGGNPFTDEFLKIVTGDSAEAK